MFTHITTIKYTMMHVCRCEELETLHMILYPTFLSYVMSYVSNYKLDLFYGQLQLCQLESCTNKRNVQLV